MKIALLGGGGWYFARPIADLAASEELRGSEISLYDIDAQRADLMARMGRRLSREAGAGLRFTVARSLAQAVDGSDFLLCSIGGYWLLVE